MKTVIEMAREAGFYKDQPMYYDETMLERFAALVREDEREKQQEPAVEHLLNAIKHLREGIEAAVLTEREACAKVCEGTRIERIKSEWDAGHETGCSSCAAAIRARGK